MGNAIDQSTGTRIGYAIRISGTLGETVLGAFPELAPTFRDGDTFLVGQLADQAALYGVLAQIEALGLGLIEIRRLTDIRSVRLSTRHSREFVAQPASQARRLTPSSRGGDRG